MEYTQPQDRETLYAEMNQFLTDEQERIQRSLKEAEEKGEQEEAENLRQRLEIIQPLMSMRWEDNDGMTAEAKYFDAWERAMEYAINLKEAYIIALRRENQYLTDLDKEYHDRFQELADMKKALNEEDRKLEKIREQLKEKEALLTQLSMRQPVNSPDDSYRLHKLKSKS